MRIINRKLRMNIGLGGPSIIMIFVILCLTTLGSLALMTANSDWKLTKKSAAAVQNYYSADCKAEEILATVDASLKAGQTLKKTLYKIPVSSHQEMILNIEVNGSDYRVLSQKLAIKNEWDYEKYQTEFNDTIVE